MKNFKINVEELGSLYLSIYDRGDCDPQESSHFKSHIGNSSQLESAKIGNEYGFQINVNGKTKNKKTDTFTSNQQKEIHRFIKRGNY